MPAACCARPCGGLGGRRHRRAATAGRARPRALVVRCRRFRAACRGRPRRARILRAGRSSGWRRARGAAAPGCPGQPRRRTSPKASSASAPGRDRGAATRPTPAAAARWKAYAQRGYAIERHDLAREAQLMAGTPRTPPRFVPTLTTRASSRRRCSRRAGAAPAAAGSAAAPAHVSLRSHRASTPGASGPPLCRRRHGFGRPSLPARGADCCTGVLQRVDLLAGGAPDATPCRRRAAATRRHAAPVCASEIAGVLRDAGDRSAWLAELAENPGSTPALAP